MKKTNMKVDLGMLFAYWLKDNKALDFDSYVERYKSDKVFMNEVNNQKEINEYNELKKEKKEKWKKN